MKTSVFSPADILIPQSNYLPEWSCNACDQFTSDEDYWRETASITGSAPGALNIILPEIWLNDRPAERYEKIFKNMSDYSDSGIFREYKNSFIYVERKLKDGSTRKGIVGKIDLEAYDWSQNSVSPVRATERTVAERLPARMDIRKRAKLEMPHIMLFIDNPEDDIIAYRDGYEQIYDFELMQNGGHIKGYRITGEYSDKLEKALESLTLPEKIKEKYGNDFCGNPVVYAIGDGNHSLAAAKELWNQAKAKGEEHIHPEYRYALVELVNIRSSGVSFYPIHKVVFGTDTGKFIEEACKYFDALEGNVEKKISLCVKDEIKDITVKCGDIGELIESAQRFCNEYTTENGGYIDYIHDTENVLKYTANQGCAGILLPTVEKAELYPFVMKKGVFPKKSFSVGHGEDKRYYLECRRLTK